MEGPSIEQILKEVENDFRNYATVFTYAGATTAMKELVDYSNVALDEFYSSYDPKVYVRWGNMRNNAVQPYMHNNGRNAYGGVRLSVSNIFDYPGAGISTEEIYDRVMFQGLHGTFASAPPYNIISDFAKSDGFRSYIEETADKTARNQDFKWLFK